MRQLFTLSLILGLLCLNACKNNTSQNNPPIPDSSSDTSLPNASTPSSSPPDCLKTGTVLPDNQIWLRSQEKLVLIKADSTTQDASYGPSHRILEVYQSTTCDLLKSFTLPINESPDYPYYLAEITYNQLSQLIAIKGNRTINCLDMNSMTMSAPLEPTFKLPRYASDAQSGSIQRLEVWEDYLVGYAIDYGAFAFDLSDPKNPKSILPVMEHQINESNFASLFLLPESENTFQAILPAYNLEEDAFQINPLFDKGIAIHKDRISGTSNNKQVLLQNTNNNSFIAIDMVNRKKISIPQKMQESSIAELLEWLGISES